MHCEEWLGYEIVSGARPLLSKVYKEEAPKDTGKEWAEVKGRSMEVVF